MKKYAILLLALLLGGCGYATKHPDNISKTYIFDIHNRSRDMRNIPTMEYDLKLEEIAQDHADWMASNGKLKHQNMRKILDAGFRMAGENIAAGQHSERQVMNAWMDSEGHKRNILNKGFTHAGVGVSENNGTLYWCTCFGGRKTLILSNANNAKIALSRK